MTNQPSEPPEREPFEYHLEGEKRTLDTLHDLLETFLIGVKYQITKNGHYLDPKLVKLIAKLVVQGEAILKKRVDVDLTDVEREIDIFIGKNPLKMGIADEDIDDREPPTPPARPPNGPKKDT